MTSSLPQPLADALTTSRPDTRTWTAICRLLDAAPDVDLAAVKKALSRWPVEVPRPAPKHWLSVCHYDKHKQLCHDAAENEQMYNLYATAIGTSPLLRLADGSPAVTMWRQPRGEVTLHTGQRLVLGGGQPGLADLGGIMVLEWSKCRHTGLECEDGKVEHLRRLQLYVEIEVKLCGRVPPTAREYVGDSKRALTTTEQEQVQRQRAQIARGGFYGFHDRVSEAIEALARYRDDVVRKLS